MESKLHLKLELDELKLHGTEEDLNRRFLKDFGCINFQSDEFLHELGLARLWHAEQLKLHPDKHAVTTKEPYRCYHVTECTCGFKEACDSSG